MWRQRLAEPGRLCVKQCFFLTAGDGGWTDRRQSEEPQGGRSEDDLLRETKGTPLFFKLPLMTDGEHLCHLPAWSHPVDKK
ncbi:hypothetical protein AMECASPLE_036649, partial [Ameca splendens]